MHTPASLRSQSINFPSPSFSCSFFLVLPPFPRASCRVPASSRPALVKFSVPGVFGLPIRIDRLLLVSFREMGLLVPSLVLSVIANCITGAKGFILCLQYPRCKENVIYEYDIVLTLILVLINILLLVFSIRGTEIALEILLSLGDGILILYQVSCLVH